MKIFLILALLANGCAGRRVRGIMPGCPGAEIYVAPGCYRQLIPGGLEVRCPGITTRYICEKRS